jgi:predicted AAA+ superfamily ATPase
MREQELLLYSDPRQENLLSNMMRLIQNYENHREKQGNNECGNNKLENNEHENNKFGNNEHGNNKLENNELRNNELRNNELVRHTFYGYMHELLEMAGRYGYKGNLWHCLVTHFLVNAENSYSISCEKRGEPLGTVNLAALHDMEIFKEYLQYDFTKMAAELDIRELALITDYESSGITSGSDRYASAICDKICELAVLLAKADSGAAIKNLLTEFYRQFGVGKLGLHKAFRIKYGHQTNHLPEIEPIPNIASVSLDDLVGYQLQKQKLLDNTLAFLDGKPANNCLLYGDAGTGKSTCIKALANTYYAQGLRVIEIYKHQFQYLPEIISALKYRHYKFIIAMDDLSFEDFEVEYKYLKAVIEGGLEKKPDNILIYATSNRRHLIRENYADKLQSAFPGGSQQTDIREDMHTGDTVQEKLSLVARFGVTIYFGVPEKKEFRQIVLTLAKRDGLNLPEDELLALGAKWEISHGGPSGRCARQFIDHLLGEQIDVR